MQNIGKGCTYRHRQANKHTRLVRRPHILRTYVCTHALAWSPSRIRCEGRKRYSRTMRDSTSGRNLGFINRTDKHIADVHVHVQYAIASLYCIVLVASGERNRAECRGRGRGRERVREGKGQGQGRSWCVIRKKEEKRKSDAACTFPMCICTKRKALFLLISLFR